MTDPFRRLCLGMAERFGMLPRDFMSQMSVAEVMELAANDLTNSPDWLKKYEREKQLEESRRFTPQQFMAAFNAGLKVHK